MRQGPAPGFLFSPSSRYPIPEAYVTDEVGNILHTWSHTAHQPEPADIPPNYLRGWNHVEVDAGGNLFAVVPLRSLLKLSPESDLEWSCDVAAHHDLDIDAAGCIYVLTEAPRRVVTDGRAQVIQDNVVTIIDQDGVVTSAYSLYDILRTDPTLRQIIDREVTRRYADFQRRCWPAPDSDGPAVVAETQAILQTGRYEGECRRALQRLRDLPGKPCDVLHTNTLELLDRHPSGVWSAGDLLLCQRELNIVTIVSLVRAEVRWWWGAGELSGPHQPSAVGDGHVLVFDNGVDRKRTRLVEVDPSSDTVVWTWSADPPESFFCPLAGGCERLANGNLLVTNSTAGGAFELTMDGRIVWQLSLPVEVFGADRGRVSIYRMSAVASETVARIRRSDRTEAPTV